MTRKLERVSVEVLQGDCLEVMARLIDEGRQFDSIVTDPPYHLTSIVKRFGGNRSALAQFGTDGAYARASKGFMGKTWDGGDIAFRPETWSLALQLLKPGGHLLAFSGTRTYHRMACAIEEAGFEVRDMISWIYGSGFPKSHNLSDEWEGWGSALKPACEPICMARKPLIGTIAQNVQEYGTGALNIDGCRVGTDERTYAPKGTSTNAAMIRVPEHRVGRAGEDVTVQGRWPANVIHDGSDEVLAEFPHAPGQLTDIKYGYEQKTKGIYGAMKRGEHEVSAERSYADNGGTNFAMKPGARRNDGGSAARFFYCAKASKRDRNEGMMETNNVHPTVKPTDLMRYLCRMVTPPGGTVFDPFTGSGSTGKACVYEDFNFVGIEKEAEYVDIARARIAFAERVVADTALKDHQQPGLFDAAD